MAERTVRWHARGAGDGGHLVGRRRRWCAARWGLGRQTAANAHQAPEASRPRKQLKPSQSQCAAHARQKERGVKAAVLTEGSKL